MSNSVSYFSFTKHRNRTILLHGANFCDFTSRPIFLISKMQIPQEINMFSKHFNNMKSRVKWYKVRKNVEFTFGIEVFSKSCISKNIQKLSLKLRTCYVNYVRALCAIWACQTLVYNCDYELSLPSFEHNILFDKTQAATLTFPRPLNLASVDRTGL